MPDVLTKPTVSLSDAARGLAQQMVLWGHDVKHPDGNALVRFGLERRKSAGLQGTSCYSAAWEGGRIELHGAVASWTGADEVGCVFCRERGRIELWQGSQPPVPGVDFGKPGVAAARWAAFQPLLRWLVAYEEWVAATLGASWRAGTWRAAKRLPRSKAWLPPALALKWWRLARDGAPPRPKTLLERH